MKLDLGKIFSQQSIWFGWTVVVAVITGLSGIIGVTLLPKMRWRRMFVRWCARTSLRILGIELQIKGDLRESPTSQVLVCNHTSYLDAIVLTAALPPSIAYVCKRELQFAPAIGFLMRRVGTLFLERSDKRRSMKDLEAVTDLVNRGDSVLFFPEGTFENEAGLLPFRLGAFTVAVRTVSPVVPVALAGVRSRLPADTWCLVPGPVQVTYGAPIAITQESDRPGWGRRESRRLLQDSHAFISQHCGEPVVTNYSSDIFPSAPALTKSA